ncbi:MAG: hypothetical protein HKP37_01425 [Boseongicola sp.]|nr:hypothetical protein [Boseongicola sp.]NNL17377.1 hypothetical protein [Boseongicola sp.]
MKLKHFVFAGITGATDRRAHEQKVARVQGNAPARNRRDRSKLYSARIWL